MNDYSNDYSKASVHELVLKIEGLGQDEQMVCEDNPVLLAIFESALRTAAVREASVGVGTVERSGEEPLPETPLMFVPWKTADGDYDIIPHKEAS